MWSPPRTWLLDEVPGSDEFNTHIRDNLLETAPAKAAAAGDLFVATGANALKVLALGNAEEILRVNAAGTDVEWFNFAVTLDTAEANLGSNTQLSTSAWATTLASISLDVGAWLVLGHVTISGNGAQITQFRLRDTTAGVTLASTQIDPVTEDHNAAVMGLVTVVSGTKTLALQGSTSIANGATALSATPDAKATGIRAVKLEQ